MAVTRNDVARRAGVSAATVSYVLNNGPRGVSPERRRRVLAAVAELEYRPNAIARSLRARRTRILGLVLPDSANPYFASLSHAIEEAAAARDYQVVVANAADRPEREAVQLESLLRLQVDGLVWIPADLRGAPPPAWRPETPMVQVDRALLRDGPPVCDTIASDHVSGGTLAAEHLLGLGHVRVAYLAGPVDHVHARERLRGFTETLRTRGLSPEPVAHGDFKYASGAAIAADWCRLPADRRPTAIACGNDAMALGVLSALAHAGLRVPGDVSVTGYDDLPQARYAVPPLSTVAQPLEEIAAAAVERLLLRVESPGGAAEAISIVLPVRFICRESTAPPPEVTPAPIAATPSTAPVATRRPWRCTRSTGCGGTPWGHEQLRRAQPAG